MNSINTNIYIKKYYIEKMSEGNIENLNPHIYSVIKKKDYNRIYEEKDLTQFDEIDKFEGNFLLLF